MFDYSLKIPVLKCFYDVQYCHDISNKAVVSSSFSLVQRRERK